MPITTASATPIRILAVDDQPDILDLIRLGLKPMPVEVFTTTDPTEAMGLIRAHKIEVVFADQSMPGMTGIELLSLVSRLHPKVFRGLITANASLDLAVDAINHCDVQAMVSKPFRSAELREVAEKAMAAARMHRRAPIEQRAPVRRARALA